MTPRKAYHMLDSFARWFVTGVGFTAFITGCAFDSWWYAMFGLSLLVVRVKLWDL